MLTDSWTTLKAGGTVANLVPIGPVATRPRAILELDARVFDPMRFSLGTGANDPEQTIAWVKNVVLRVVESYLATRGLMNALSGAYPLAEDVTPLANTELEPMGIEVAVKLLELSLSDEDQEAVQRAAEAAAEAMLRG